MPLQNFYQELHCLCTRMRENEQYRDSFKPFALHSIEIFFKQFNFCCVILEILLLLFFVTEWEGEFSLSLFPLWILHSIFLYFYQLQSLTVSRNAVMLVVPIVMTSSCQNIKDDGSIDHQETWMHCLSHRKIRYECKWTGAVYSSGDEDAVMHLLPNKNFIGSQVVT